MAMRPSFDGEPSSPMRDNDEYLSDEEVIEKQPEFEEGLILKQGYLLKKNHNLKKWKKRWFVLRKDRLNVYKNEKEYELIRIIKLKDCRLKEGKEKGKDKVFGLSTPTRSFYLQATSFQERIDWIDNLVQAGAAPMLDYSSNPESPITPKDPHFPSRMSSDSPKLEKKNSNLQPSKIYASDDNELTSDDEGEEKLSAVGIDTVPKEGVIKQGYLLKQTLVRKKWKKRWVVLREGGKLTYYKNEEEYELLNLIKLRNCQDISVITDHKKKEHKFSFQVAYRNRTFHFVAPTEEEMNSWVEVLNEEKTKSLHHHAQTHNEGNTSPEI